MLKFVLFIFVLLFTCAVQIEFPYISPASRSAQLSPIKVTVLHPRFKKPLPFFYYDSKISVYCTRNDTTQIVLKVDNRLLTTEDGHELFYENHIDKFKLNAHLTCEFFKNQHNTDNASFILQYRSCKPEQFEFGRRVCVNGTNDPNTNANASEHKLRSCIVDPVDPNGAFCSAKDTVCGDADVDRPQYSGVCMGDGFRYTLCLPLTEKENRQLPNKDYPDQVVYQETVVADENHVDECKRHKFGLIVNVNDTRDHFKLPVLGSVVRLNKSQAEVQMSCVDGFSVTLSTWFLNEVSELTGKCTITTTTGVVDVPLPINMTGEGTEIVEYYLDAILLADWSKNVLKTIKHHTYGILLYLNAEVKLDINECMMNKIVVTCRFVYNQPNDKRLKATTHWIHNNEAISHINGQVTITNITNDAPYSCFGSLSFTNYLFDYIETSNETSKEVVLIPPTCASTVLEETDSASTGYDVTTIMLILIGVILSLAVLILVPVLIWMIVQRKNKRSKADTDSQLATKTAESGSKYHQKPHFSTAASQETTRSFRVSEKES